MSRFGWGVRDDAEPLTTGYDPRTGVVRALPCGAHASRRGACCSDPAPTWELLAGAACSPATPQVQVSRVCCRCQALPGPRRELPRKAVAFAALLLAAGFSCLVAGLALGAQGTANATALFVLGALMFTPVRAYALRRRGRAGACTPAVAVGSRLVPRHRVAGTPVARLREQRCSQP
jgi:hypothetical protein